jgi:hypothetical protein
MKKKFLVWGAAWLAALILVGAVGAGIAYADDATPPAPVAGIPGDGRGPHGGRGMGQAELEAAAKVLGMTPDELSTALRNGQTLADLATTAGVDVQDVQAAIQAVRATEMRTRIEQAVSDGTMTQDKADWLLEGLDKGYLDGPGFGFGFGPHGPGGPGEPPVDQPAQPTATEPAATP